MRSLLLVLVIPVVLSCSGCGAVRCLRDAHIFPFSCAPCPYYNYRTGTWMSSPGVIRPPLGFPRPDDEAADPLLDLEEGTGVDGGLEAPLPPMTTAPDLNQ